VKGVLIVAPKPSYLSIGNIFIHQLVLLFGIVYLIYKDVLFIASSLGILSNCYVAGSRVLMLYYVSTMYLTFTITRNELKHGNLTRFKFTKDAKSFPQTTQRNRDFWCFYPEAQGRWIRGANFGIMTLMMDDLLCVETRLSAAA